jgi:transposase
MSAASDKPPPITSALAPNLQAVGKFIVDMIAKGAIEALVAAIVALLVRMRDLNLELMRKLASKSRKRPPSETMRRLQMELPFVVTAPANDGEPPAPPADKKRKKRGAKAPTPHGRPQLPAHLPRVPHVLLVDASKCKCPHCQVETKRIAVKTTAEKLDARPLDFVVSQTQVETRACPLCDYIVSADAPDQVVDRGILGDELLVQALVDHYQDAVPFERMERNARQQDVPLAANTLASSVAKLIDLFDPIVGHIREQALSASFTAFDATRMPVLDTAHPLGIKSGALWLVEGDHRYACFLYAPSGHADHLKEFFEGRTFGSVMCDGSPTNNCVEQQGGRRGGCNAHGRRGLVYAVRGGDARAVEGLELYAKIFRVDAESKRLGESLEQRFERRRRDSAPVVDELRAWVERGRDEVEPKTPLGKALGYLHRQWPRLTEFLRDPLMELTNNEVEADLRPWCANRKMWLFVGHELSARRAADALTLITTCKKMGLNPRTYLRDTLAKILAGEKSLAVLLPETYAAARAERTPAAAA